MKCLVSYTQNSARPAEHDSSYTIQGFGRLMPLITNTQAEADYLSSMALMMGENPQIFVNDPGDRQLYCWVSIPELSQGETQCGS